MNDSQFTNSLGKKINQWRNTSFNSNSNNYVTGMSNVTKVTTAGSPLEVALSTYGLKDVTNVEISWDIGGSVANKGKIRN